MSVFVIQVNAAFVGLLRTLFSFMNIPLLLRVKTVNIHIHGEMEI